MRYVGVSIFLCYLAGSFASGTLINDKPSAWADHGCPWLPYHRASGPVVCRGDCYVVFAGAVPLELGQVQATSQIQELATKAAYFLPTFDQADGQCEVTCNNEEVDTASIYSTSEPRTCVGTLKVESCHHSARLANGATLHVNAHMILSGPCRYSAQATVHLG